MIDRGTSGARSFTYLAPLSIAVFVRGHVARIIVRGYKWLFKEQTGDLTVRRRDGESGRREGKEGGEEEGEEEEMPTEAVAAAAVTSRLVFLITPDPGRAEEEELLSDVSIMTRLCTEVRIVYSARKTSTARREDEGKCGRVFVHASGHFPPKEQGGNRKAR